MEKRINRKLMHGVCMAVMCCCVAAAWAAACVGGHDGLLTAFAVASAAAAFGAVATDGLGRP